MATKEEILAELKQAVVDYEEDDCRDAAQKALDHPELLDELRPAALGDEAVVTLAGLPVAIRVDLQLGPHVGPGLVGVDHHRPGHLQQVLHVRQRRDGHRPGPDQCLDHAELGRPVTDGALRRRAAQ